MFSCIWTKTISVVVQNIGDTVLWETCIAIKLTLQFSSYVIWSIRDIVRQMLRLSRFPCSSEVTQSNKIDLILLLELQETAIIYIIHQFLPISIKSQQLHDYNSFITFHFNFLNLKLWKQKSSGGFKFMDFPGQAGKENSFGSTLIRRK